MAVNEIDQLIQRIASERKLSKEFVVEKFKEAVVDVLKKTWTKFLFSCLIRP